MLLNCILYCPCYSLVDSRLSQQPGPGPGRLGWLAWFKMLLAWGGWGWRGGGGDNILSVFLEEHINVFLFLIIMQYCFFRHFSSEKEPPEAAQLPSNRGLFLDPRSLCMHKILVHAQHSCACSGPGNPGALAPVFPGPELSHK